MVILQAAINVKNSTNVQEIIRLILYAISIIFPSLIALSAQLKKRYLNKALSGLQQTVQDGFDSNIIQHKQITKTLLQHTQAISKYIQQKNIAIRLRQIAKHAIDYCGNRNLGKVIDCFTEQFISFVQDITTIGFQNTNRQQIIAKLSLARDNSNRLAIDVMGKQQVIK